MCFSFEDTVKGLEMICVAECAGLSLSIMFWDYSILFFPFLLMSLKIFFIHATET